MHNSGKGAKFTRGRNWKLIYKESFNYLYIDALLEELDGNKNLFLSYEIKSFKRKSSSYKKNRENFDINLAYEILNTYFNRVIEISEYQIKLAKKDSFDLSIDEGIDIFYDFLISLKDETA